MTETLPPKDRMHVIYGLKGHFYRYSVVFDADLIEGSARERERWHDWEPIALVWGVRVTLPLRRNEYLPDLRHREFIAMPIDFLERIGEKPLPPRHGDSPEPLSAHDLVWDNFPPERGITVKLLRERPED